ncbi:MAG: hypothetical protein ACI9NC_000644 [Verrucomicrobiales bacterium]|jgi:hypothetical protein
MICRISLLTALATCSIVSAAPKFERQVIDDKIAIGYGLAIGDVDGDKKPDILLADQHQIAWYRNGDWKRFEIAEHLNPPVGARHRDNVCIAARDIDGDGLVEIAVGGQWNPGETTDDTKSGSVHYLVRPKDPTQKWKPIKLHHEPTVHRMHWVRTGEKEFKLVVLPLHGRGNKKGEGAPVKVLAYDVPENREDGKAWKTTVVDESMHMTHNFDMITNWLGKEKVREPMIFAGVEGARMAIPKETGWTHMDFPSRLIAGSGEIRHSDELIAAISPMHGNKVIAVRSDYIGAKTIDTTLNQGHALAIGDFLSLGKSRQQIIAGWRAPDKNGKVGIKLYVPKTKDIQGDWETHLIDDNGMACEDLKLADLDGDGKQDIIASGRATKNVVIYWNKN